MYGTTDFDIGGKVVFVTDLVGRLLEAPTKIQPVGMDVRQWIPKAIALQIDGIPIGWSTYRPADLTGRFPIWREFVRNIGDVDTAPVGIPMGPRHFRVLATPFSEGGY